MDEFRADLHCHSICSDGTDAPLELLEKAKEAGLQGLSITDHDTVAAYSPELFRKAQELSLALLPGVEISSELDALPVHILAYGFPIDPSSIYPNNLNSCLGIHALLEEVRCRRTERNRAILKKLEKNGMLIAEEELSRRKPWTAGRSHIAQKMVEKGYVASIERAFQYYLGDRACCYVPGFKVTPQEAINFIHQSGAKAVLAHPHLYRKSSFLKKILQCSFDGIECYYGNLSPAQERPWLELAAQRGWIATGGSDYHGTRRSVSLGASWVGKETFLALNPGIY